MIAKLHTAVERVLTEERRLLLESAGLLLLRLSAGGTMLLAHGWGKLLAFSDKADSFPDPIGLGGPISMALAIFAEALCALFVVLGFATRLALIPLITTMLVAVLIVHGGDPWAKKELGFLYLTAYGCLLLTGPGRWSLDAVLRDRLRAQSPGDSA